MLSEANSSNHHGCEEASVLTTPQQRFRFSARRIDAVMPRRYVDNRSSLSGGHAAISARLSRVIHRQLGEDAGQDLISWMGQMESSRSEFRDLMNGYNARTDLRFEAFEARQDARFAELEGRLVAAIANTRADLIKWSFVFWSGSVFATAALVLSLK
jgi:hypothetical protein